MIARIQKSMTQKDKGFTLIELLVVIIIIGILAAIAIPMFLNQRERAVDTTIRSDLRTIATELEGYFVDNQSYPASGSSAAGAATFTAPGTGEGATALTVQLSDDATVVTYAPADGSYVLTGYNANGGFDSATNAIQYDSALGGFQD